jgi:heparosan-N-sulfate-glucuronate 5-epimerase
VNPGFFSSSRSFAPVVGRFVRPAEPRGYYIDFRFKAESPRWPPEWLKPRASQLHVTTAQWGLGAFERYVNGEGGEWLDAAQAAALHLVREQESAGRHEGGWIHRFPMPHTFRLDPPWLSAMAQGEGASLLVRLHLETGVDDYKEAALLALKSFRVPSSAGGVQARLDGGPFFEEYPTTPPSLVLNGGIFALWGAYDVAVGLGDPEAKRDFRAGLDTLATDINRWDTGSWSRYDRYPFPVPNVASSAYHLLHITQLDAMALIERRPELERAADRFRAQMNRRANRVRAFASKAAFRLIVPRNRWLGRRLPWLRPTRAQPG